MKTVVITGADGFIGSSLTSFLASKNTIIYAFVLNNSLLIENIKHINNLTIIECDYNNIFENLHLIPKGIDTFFHLAWNGVSPELRHSFVTQYSNIDISLNCLRFAKECNAKKFITLGSTMEYLYNDKPIDETAIATPENAYGSIKLATRYLCQSLAEELNIDFIYAISTGIYGEKRIDNNIITYTIKSLLRGEVPQLTKLEQKWNYVHINDLTNALYLLGLKGLKNTIYTIGSSDNWELKKYIEIIKNQIDPSLVLGLGNIPYAKNKLPSSCVNLTQITKDTGYKPKMIFSDAITNVIEKIKSTL